MTKQPDSTGHFGEFGGAFVPDTLYPALKTLTEKYQSLKDNEKFKNKIKSYSNDYVGRPTPLYFAERLSEYCKAKVYLKREDLNHTGAHKINNALGQALLAIEMGKNRIIAETGAGQHGVATATVCARFGLECVVYMGAEDVRRQALNVYRMKLLGATVVPVESGSKTLKDATTEAIRDWMSSVETSHYIVGSVVGPHPYPEMVRDFQSIIGFEARKSILDKEGRLPDLCIACVGGGSNAMGLFHAFVPDKNVNILAVEAAGHGLDKEHAASLTKGRPGILHGARSYLLQTEEGQVSLAHSISAGLDYPGVGPEISFLKDENRLNVLAVTDHQAMEGCRWVSELEGIIPALETSHAFYALKTGHNFKENDIVVLNVSGRGDKDMETIRRWDNAE